MNDINDKLVFLLQKGLPLESRPFAVIAKELGISEDEVIESVKDLQKSGLIRRFGCVFNSESLGFKSCLCAVRVPDSDLDRINNIISPDPGVTHCYIRDDELNFWFTYTAKKDDYEKGLEEFRQKLEPLEFLLLPAIQKFKIQVIFDKTGSDKNNLQRMKKTEVLNLSEKEKKSVSYLQGNIPVKVDLYREIAEELDYSEDELLDLLKKWKEKGALKRVSAIIRHQKFGFKGNAMCAWNVPEDKVLEVGEELAELPEVSHCYQREMFPEFPYNIYAMVHAESEEGVKKKFEEISKNENLQNGRMLSSKKELKKTSPVYFQPKMQLSVYIMTVIVFLLVTGAFPLMGAEEVYKSAFMIILLGLLSILTLVCCSKQALSAIIALLHGGKYRLKFRKLGFYLSHIGAVVLLAGALIGYIWGKKVSFGIYVGDQYVVDHLIDQSKPEDGVKLDFSFCLTDLTVEKYDPSFFLYKKIGPGPSDYQFIKKYNLTEGKIILDEGLDEISENQLRDRNGNWPPHYFINDDYVLTLTATDKRNSAKFNVINGDRKKTFDLEINNPVTYKKWKFYFMNYDRTPRGDVIFLTARNDPGRRTVISGIWMLIVGIFMMCFLRKK